MCIKKSLVVTNTASAIDQFCMSDIEILSKNYNVEVGANFKSGNNTSLKRINDFKNELKIKDVLFNEIEFDRNPLKINNLKAYKRLKKLISEKEYYLIHCHTPIVAMITRLIIMFHKTGNIKVIYTAHGFHFYKGAPMINWLIYYPIEKYLSRYTDVLITINKEDFIRAKNFKAKKLEYIPGVGVDLDKINSIKINKDIKCLDLNLPTDAFIIISVGELNKNKNHEKVIRAIAQLNDNNNHYLICGQGNLELNLKKLSRKLGIESQIHFLGYRSDVLEILKIADVFVFLSYREGLSVALMESMASGLPVICSKIRGNVDLIKDGENGYLIEPNDIKAITRYINKIKNNDKLRKELSNNNIKKIKDFSKKNVMAKMKKIYNNIDDITP